MKISKLFHWLYAILMLLPICGIFFKVGYVIFNENAFQSYTGTYTYEDTTNLLQYTTNPVTTVITTTQGRYVWSLNNTRVGFGRLSINNDNYQNYFRVAYNITDFKNNSDWNITIPSEYKSVVIGTKTASTERQIHIAFYDDYLININLATDMYNFPNNSPTQRITIRENTSIDFTFQVASSDSYYWRYTASISDSLYQYFYFNTYVYDNTLSSVFYSSLQELDNTEFFSWAKDSFLVTPIMYIGNLFGITSPHPIFTLMSYWLAISIIWLVFDLVMYLPLLIHRWLDKGVIE